MAQSLVIRNRCDVCLSRDEETAADTYRVDVRVMPPDAHTESATPARAEDNPPPFLVELCPEHGSDIANAVLALVEYGRPDEKSRRPAGTTRRARADEEPTTITCPECGTGYASLAAARSHIRTVHGKSLAAVGLAPANFTCDVCGDAFPNRQGLAAHRRMIHPGVKQSA